MKLVNDTNITKYNEFLTNHSRCNFQQSVEWAKVKSNWVNEIVIVENDDGEIIGSLSVLIRKIPIFGNMMYSPRGPVCDIHRQKSFGRINKWVKRTVKKI